MNEADGSNILEKMSLTPMTGGEDMQDIEVEQLLGNLERMQEDKSVLQGEIKELESFNETLQKNLETLQMEAYKLEGVQKEKEDLLQKLQFQCEECERDSAITKANRQVEHNKKSEERIEQYRCEILKLRLQRRKQRMKFDNDLQQLIEQHKKLNTVFAPDRLPAEIANTEKRKSQLLEVEQQKLAHLHCLDEMTEELKKQQQLGTTATVTQEE